MMMTPRHREGLQTIHKSNWSKIYTLICFLLKLEMLKLNTYRRPCSLKLRTRDFEFPIQTKNFVNGYCGQLHHAV